MTRAADQTTAAGPYLSDYDRVLLAHRHKPVRVLGIGQSIDVWRAYFPNASQIVGADMPPDGAQPQHNDGDAPVAAGKAHTDGAGTGMAQRCPTFDLVIDDPSRRCEPIAQSFLRYFPRLSDAGIFIVQDDRTGSDREALSGGGFDAASSLTFFKRLAVLKNHPFCSVAPSRSSVADRFAGDYGIDVSEELISQIHSIEIVNSLCVIRKAAPTGTPSLVQRQLAASERAELVGLVARIVRLTAELDTAHKRLQQLLSSTSGQLSEPVRWFQRWNRARVAGRRKRMGKDIAARAAHYASWIRFFASIDDDARARMSGRVKQMSDPPLISVVMPTYNPDATWLRAAIDSVRSQIYPHWELCIADDATTAPESLIALHSCTEGDARIKIAFRSENGHISAASNTALGLARGDWIVLMDHDDLLSEDALFWIADAIAKRPDVALIYSDEDKVNAAGVRTDPYFKPDWNIDLFYSHNLFSHLGAYRTDLVRKVGGFRVGLEGSQDYDLVLRCLPHVSDAQIHHVPKVLYHWRSHAQSTASSNEAKPYAALAGERALNEHFERTGVRARIEHVDIGYRVRYELPRQLPLVSLVIPTRNAVDLVRQCVASIFERTTYPRYEIILVDNGSDDPEALAYFSAMQSAGVLRVVRDDGEFNYSALNNRAVATARGEVVGLINNDIEVISADWLSEMVSIALQPGVGAVGARLWYPDTTLQHGGVVLGFGGVAGHAHKKLPKGSPGYCGRAALIQSFSAVTAACMVIRKDLYDAVRGFNETELKVEFNDVDFCLRLRQAGFRNVWTPYSELLHHESGTRGTDNTPAKRKRHAAEIDYLIRRWGDVLLFDPAYSPNLTLRSEDFGYAWPPRERPDMKLD